MSLFEELKRRNVFRVAVLYIVTGWLALQMGDVLFELLGVPDWTLKFVFGVLVLGFPFALFFSWAYELTPEGLKKESEVDRSQSITPQTGRRLDRLALAVMALVIIVLLVDRSRTGDGEGTDPQAPAAAKSEAAEARPDPKSIAVLPFDDFTAAGEDDWFADGLTEEILNVLTRAPDLLVASRTASFRFQDSDLPLAEIADQLGVAHLLEGSVRRSPERIRVTAQLIRAADGFHLWSENYDREPSEVIAIQEDIALSIARALETAMDPEALERMLRAGTRSVEAYTAYLKGLASTSDALAEGSFDVSEAIASFEQARALDARFAEASYEVARLYRSAASATIMMVADRSAAELRERFEAAIDAAIQTSSDPLLRLKYEALEAQAELHFSEARDKLEEYLAGRPNDFQSWLEYGGIAKKMQDVAAARRSVEERLRISPRNLVQIGALDLLQVGLLDDAIDLFRRALELDSGANTLYQAHRGFLWAGLDEEAERLEKKLLASDLPQRYKNVARLRGACARGDREAAERLFASVDADDLFGRWYGLKLLERKAEATALLAPLDETEAGRDDLGGYLSYRHFDASPFPNLSAALERDGIHRPPPVEIPFACPPPEQPTIAVLPFADLSPQGDQAYFGDGIAEELLNALVRIDGLKVAGRTSSFAYRDSNADLTAIGAKLGVAHIVEGSVRKAGDRVRVTAQLVQSADGFHLWSQTYDRTLDDIFAIQDEITGEIVAALKDNLPGLEKAQAAQTTGTESIEAYNAFLQGRYLLHQRGSENILRAQDLLRKAVALDPGFADAHAQLARTLSVGWGVADPERALDAANRALELAPDSPIALMAYGGAEHRPEKVEDAIAALERSLSIQPENAEAMHVLAGLRIDYQGDLEAAIELERRARTLDPTGVIYPIWLGLYELGAGRVDTGLGLLEEARELDPSVIGFLAFATAIAGDVEAARAMGLSEEDERFEAIMESLYDALDGQHDQARSTVLEYEPTLQGEGHAYAALTMLIAGDVDSANRIMNGFRDSVMLSRWRLIFGYLPNVDIRATVYPEIMTARGMPMYVYPENPPGASRPHRD